MFFLVQQIEEAMYSADGLQNPKNPGNAMALGIYRTHFKTAIVKSQSKKPAGIYWDTVLNKRIANRHWTPEMKAFAQQKVSEMPKPTYFMKLTLVGWLVMMLVIAFFGYLFYDSQKPPLPKSATSIAMEQQPAVGDIYFGHYEIYQEKGAPIGAKVGFGWFKIAKVEGNNYLIATSKAMSKNAQPKAQMDSVNFEIETLPALQLKELKPYSVRFKSADGLAEVYLSDKKTK